MTLDGDKLLVKLEELAWLYRADKVKCLDQRDLLEAAASSIAESSYRNVIDHIKSGDYTIE